MTTPEQPTGQTDQAPLDVAELIRLAHELISEGLDSRIREPAAGWRLRAGFWTDMHHQYHGLAGMAQGGGMITPPNAPAIREVHL